MTETLAGSPLVYAIGLALVDFVWQGAAIGIATALLLAALRRSTADARYIVACLGLSAMALAPIATTTYRARAESMPTGDPEITIRLTIANTNALPDVLAQKPFSRDAATPQEPVPPSLSGRLTPWLPTIVVLWIGGVAALSLNLIRGWIQARRLLRHATSMSASVWPTRMRLMADRLDLKLKIRLVKSALVDVPAVIGWMRPAIVVPVSVLSGLAPAHLDAILAHELSHIRRRDYLVNIVQCVVETLLFYHPAVWWVSRRIRVERELCCDDLAASLCDSRLTYATALASLETLRASTPALAMPATGGVLLHRIRRLVDPRCASIPEFSGGFAMCVVATLLLFVSQAMATPPVTSPATADVTVASSPAPTRSVAAMTPVEPGQPQVKPQPPQVVVGSVEGTVLDASRGRLPGVTVTLTSAVSALTRTATTDTRGRFVFTDVPAGAYDVTMSLQGFKTTRGRVQLASGQRAAMEVLLEVGRLTETVELRGQAPSVTGTEQRRAAAPFLDAARRFYEQGRFADAEAMAVRALEQIRAEAREQVIPNVEPRDSRDPSGPIRVGGGIREPRKIRNVAPVYPEEAQRAGVQGYVLMEALIGTDGSVRDAKVLGGEPLLADAALTAVRQWIYTPTLLNGVPVEVLMNVTMHFKLNRP